MAELCESVSLSCSAQHCLCSVCSSDCYWFLHKETQLMFRWCTTACEIKYISYTELYDAIIVMLQLSNTCRSQEAGARQSTRLVNEAMSLWGQGRGRGQKEWGRGHRERGRGQSSRGQGRGHKL